MAEKLEQRLQEVGSKLETPPVSKDALVKLLKQAATCLSEMEQSPSTSMLESMQPLLDAIVKPELLKHHDRDVKLLVATCICEITRITAPEAPYGDDVLKDIFHLIVGTFSGLSDTSGPSFSRRVVILETLAKYRSCVVMLDLGCDDLVNKMFSTFFAVASDDHQESVLSSMLTIMEVLIEESEEVRDDLLLIILSVLGRNRNDISKASRRLAMNVIERCAGKLEAHIKQFLLSSMSGDTRSADVQIDYHEVIYDIYRCAPQILAGVVPYLTGELLADQLDSRLKAVGLVGDLFALPVHDTAEVFHPIFSEFLKRLTDRVVSVRMSVLEHVKSYLLSNPFQPEAPQIISDLCDRLLDYDENVRKEVVDVICNVACHALNSIPVETIKLVAERLRDKSLLVKRYTMERLAEIFRVYCVKFSDGSVDPTQFDWIPGKILRCFYDKDFRSDTIEFLFCGPLFPSEFSVKDRFKHWVRAFSVFDKIEVKAFEKILEQKQRLQQEMQRYLSLRQMHQDGDAPEIQKKVMFCFRIMSRTFADPAKAEENFQILDQLKDSNIWKILNNLLDPNTSFQQACIGRDDLLKILGEKHRLYDFLSNLSVKCSYLLINKEHIKELLSEASTHKSNGNIEFTQSSIDILVILARISPLLLGGVEEQLVNFLKDENEIIKEGALIILAKAGGTIREQLAVSSSSIDLILERLCLEGSRRQAKYAVHALAAITKDDGLKSLSVLYKRLVDMLEGKRHLPAVLQSLGCIAETAMPVFETRETEIEDFIKSKILECSNKPEDDAKACWDDRSELCLLKIYGIKTLVKSYLPVKDAQLRPGIDGLLQILRNILLFGEISKDIQSSSVDKAHLRLASAKAVLRLSKQWDHKIPVDIFHLTVRTAESAFPQARKQFLSKVHQYIKDRLLDAKYACAFLYDITGSKPIDFNEEKQNLADIIQMHYQAKARHLSVQSDSNPLEAYPEYILPYLVHILAHHSCPNVDECKDVKAFEPLYRQLFLVLSMLLHKDEDVKSEASTNKEKESISAIVSIFQSIKCSEDVVDAAKSKNSHAISELGLAITKRLAQKEDDLQKLATSISLPTLLYKECERMEENDSVANGRKTWLADEAVLSHFDSLKLETDGMVNSDTAEEDAAKDSGTELNELPLGKIIKQLRSRRTKSEKAAKVKNVESDVGILKMVREINLDNLGKFESSNGHKHFPSRKTKSELDHQKVKKRSPSNLTSVAVPKRQRSASSTLRLSQTTSKATLGASGDDSSPDSKDKKRPPRKMVESNESDLLVSSIRKSKSLTSKDQHKSYDADNSVAENEVGEASDDDVMKPDALVDTDEINATNNSKSASSKKRKRRSVAGLAKCTSKESAVDIEELIGFRIKVWWPMDKAFYEGTVKSYDPTKRKHVILYDDGDVEVLRLEKERWELADKGRKPTKKNSSKRPSSEALSAQKKRSSGSSHQNNKPVKIVKGKRTPKKNSQHVQQDPKYRGDSDISDPKPTRVSKRNKKKLGDSGEEHSEKVNQFLTDDQESDKVLSTSDGKHFEETEESPNHSEESDGEAKSKHKAKVLEDGENMKQEFGKDENEDGTHSEEKDVHEPSETFKEEVNEENEEETLSDEREAPNSSEVNEVKPDSDGVQDPSDEKEENREKENETHSEVKAVRVRRANKDRKKQRVESSNPPNAGDVDISDNEPLRKWKHKAAKSALRRAR